MNYSKYRFTLDIHKTKSQVSIPIMFGDTNIKFYMSINDGGTPYKIEEGCTAKFVGRKPSGHFFYHDCDIEDNKIVYTFKNNTANELGVTRCEVRIFGPTEGTLTTPTFFMDVGEKVISDEEVEDYIESSSDLSGLNDIHTSELNRVNAEAERVAAEEKRAEFYESILLAKQRGELNGKDGADGTNGANGTDGEDGVGIASIEQTTFSADDGGSNEFTITLTNGKTATLVVKNGSKGSNGGAGKDGENGKDGNTPYIQDGYWYINGVNTNVQAKGVDGTNGAKGADGKDGAAGKDGADGKDGTDGLSITATEINSSGQLILTFSDGTTKNVGNVIGAAGKDGTSVNILGSFDSIEELPTANNAKGDAYLIKGHLYIWTGTEWKDGGNIQGPAGADGLSITSAELNGSGQLVLTRSDGKTLTVGKVTGANGKDGTNGADGEDGKTPQLRINEDYWEVSYDNGSTWASLGVKAVGEDGKNGADGKDGELTSDQLGLLEKLSAWYDDEHYVAMTGTFSMSPATTTCEMGSSRDVKFSWTFSKLPTEVTFNGTPQTAAQSGSSTVTVTSQSHKTLIYSLYGKYKEGETVSKSLSINFRNRYYYGYRAIPTTLDGTFIKGLGNSDWASAKTISFTPNCASGTYVWYAYPKRLGKAQMWMGGFQGGFEEPTSIPVTNSSGYTEDYYVYRSTNSGIGDLSIQAK